MTAPLACGRITWRQFWLKKLQTVLARGLLNTRMRDFYDIKTLLSIYEQDIDTDVLNKAFEATCKKRSTENLKEEAPKIMAAVSDDAQLHTTLEVLSEEISVCGNCVFLSAFKTDYK